MSITLVAIGTTHHTLAKFALEKTLKVVPHITKIKVFSDKNLGIGEFHELPKSFNLGDYSVFAMKELNQYIDTDHVIMCHYDGMGVNQQYWDDRFLSYDYLGSTTHYKHPPLHKTLVESRLLDKIDQQWYSLGGGFCLRSKKLLQALSDPEIKTTFHNYVHGGDWTCEDISICIIYKELLEKKYGIKFGSFEDSTQFCAEILSGYNFCVGFHGWQQVPLFFDENETMYYIKEYIKSAGVQNTYVKKLKNFLGNCYVQDYDSVIDYLRKTIKYL